MAEDKTPKIHQSAADKKHADSERDKKNKRRGYKPGRIKHFKKGSGSE